MRIIFEIKDDAEDKDNIPLYFKRAIEDFYLEKYVKEMTIEGDENAKQTMP